MLTAALLTLFVATYATGPAGADDRKARKFRLTFPRAVAVKGA